MKNVIVGLGICGAISLSFLVLLMMGPLPVSETEPNLPEEKTKKESVTKSAGSEAGAPSTQSEDHIQFRKTELPGLDATLIQDNGQLVLSLQAPNTGPVEFNFFDMNGKKIYSHTDLTLAGENQYGFSLQYVVPGVYFIEASWANTTRVAKIPDLHKFPNCLLFR